ncbi:MAG: dTMP kinase [Spirochaetes bacterium]|nr:dTMP kinase [Spirochaetota bacterium]
MAAAAFYFSGFCGIIRKMEIIPNFAVFEGLDGSGTTSQQTLLAEYLEKNNAPFFATAEPTAGPVGTLLRQALKKNISLAPQTMARLFAADRCEHLYGKDGIAERSAKGQLVVCDRYVLSSLVYQGIECGDELPAALNADFPAPHLLVYLDIDPALAQQRLKSRQTLEIYEYPEFQAKVREKYLSLLDRFRQAGVEVAVIDAAKSPKEVFEQVLGAFAKMPIFKDMKMEKAR